MNSKDAQDYSKKFALKLLKMKISLEVYWLNLKVGRFSWTWFEKKRKKTNEKELEIRTILMWKQKLSLTLWKVILIIENIFIKTKMNKLWK